MCLMKKNVGWGRSKELLYLVMITMKRVGYHGWYAHYFESDCWARHHTCFWH